MVHEVETLNTLKQGNRFQILITSIQILPQQTNTCTGDSNRFEVHFHNQIVVFCRTAVWEPQELGWDGPCWYPVQRAPTQFIVLFTLLVGL